MNGKFYGGRQLNAEYSLVTDFREAKCRQYKEGECVFGGFCNFMHPKPVKRDFKKDLFRWMYDKYAMYKEDRRKRKIEENHRKDRAGYDEDRYRDRDGRRRERRRKRLRT